MYYLLKNIALNQAVNSHRYFHSAAIIVGKTRFFGWNSYKTSPKCSRWKTQSNGERVQAHCHHAEMHAMFKALSGCDDLSSAKVIVVRVNRSEEFTMAKPCAHCQIFLKKHGINPRNIFYTGWEGEIIKLMFWD